VALRTGNGDNLRKSPQRIHKNRKKLFTQHATHWKSIGQYAKVLWMFFPLKSGALKARADLPSKAYFLLAKVWLAVGIIQAQREGRRRGIAIRDAADENLPLKILPR